MRGEAEGLTTVFGSSLIVEAGEGRAGTRPLLIGMVHGMAGSAALTLLVLATISSTLTGFLYIAIFGVGSMGGMAEALFALSSKLSARRFTILIYCSEK